MASQLLSVTVGQLSSYGIQLPQLQYVAPGPMAAWDGEQVTCHLLQSYEGSPIAQSDFQLSGYAEHTAEFVISIVRITPVMSDLGTPPTPAQVMASTQANMADIAGLIASMETIKNKALWVDHATPFAIGPAQTVGPEGGLVAAVITCKVGVYT